MTEKSPTIDCRLLRVSKFHWDDSHLFSNMLLPFHRLSFSNNDLFSFFTNRPSFLQNKLVFRWIALACVTIAFIWVANSALAPRLELPLNPPLQPTKEEQAVWELRKNEVRNAFKHAWSGYKTIAYPDDELCPISGRTSNKLSPSFFFLSFFPLIFILFTKKGLTVGV